MPSLVINGPVVPADTQNMVLRDALLHSPAERQPSASNYLVIEVGVREGSYTSWVGTWTQATQKVDAAEPVSILNSGREGMRLRGGQAIVVRLTTYGTPDTIEGSRVNFRLALVGGRDGVAKPLVAAGASVADPLSRSAIAALERQINTGGLSEWDEPVQLQDPAPLIATGTFHGRLQRDSATQISLQRYSGNWIDVDGVPVSIGSSGLTLTSTTTLLLTSAGAFSGSLSTSTLYYAYVGSLAGGPAQLRLSTTAPTRYLGTYYLGSDDGTKRWRFVGWVRTNSSTQFVDDTTDRLVVNYYNRLWKALYVVPAYTDDDANTSYTTTSTTWTAANGGTGATASYIANGEDGIHVTAFSAAQNSGASTTRIGIGDNSATSAASRASCPGTTLESLACSYATTPATGYRTLVLLVSVSGGTGTYTADFARNGSTADPVATALYTKVPV